MKRVIVAVAAVLIAGLTVSTVVMAVELTELQNRVASIPEGPPGATGPRGIQGLRGPAGPSYVIVPDTLSSEGSCGVSTSYPNPGSIWVPEYAFRDGGGIGLSYIYTTGGTCYRLQEGF